MQATTDSERERHAGIPPREEEEMSDDSSTLTGESLEAVTPTITPRYLTGPGPGGSFILYTRQTRLGRG